MVESCSKKLPLSSAALVCGYTGLLHQYSDCGGVFCPLFTTTTVKRGRFGKRSENFFIFPVCSLQQSGGVVCQRFLKMGAKKAVNLFKIYCLSAAVMGGGIKLSAVFQMEFICNRFLSAFQFLFCNLPFPAVPIVSARHSHVPMLPCKAVWSRPYCRSSVPDNLKSVLPLCPPA